MAVAAVVAVTLLTWAVLIVSTLSADRGALTSAPVATIRIDASESVAARLERRQRALDALVQKHFGDEAEADLPITARATGPLAHVEQQQVMFARTLAAAADERARRAEQSLRKLGLNPRAMTKGAAMGGPLIPVDSDEALDMLASSLARLERLEQALSRVPTSQPTLPMTLSSGFGIRSDPLLGTAALHAGMDVTGGHGQAIRAAAPGRVVHVGPNGAYGKLVTLDHGNGVETRYGHLSGFAVGLGDRVARGETIARMGNTGRSTGTHLHFEVRVHGRAVNPRKFLNADLAID